MKRILLLALLQLAACQNRTSEDERIVFDCDDRRQRIHSFGASDCWRTQYIGKNWPLEKREAMADLLFSSRYDASGNPEGIGLTLWRFNIGSGSHEAGERGGVASPWRRTECFLDSEGRWDAEKQAGQRWMLDAARRRGVPYALGFSISAPYFLSKNGMARASERTPHANLRDDAYDAYASLLAEAAVRLDLDYLSPVNEPQWEWVASKQEGMQATNEECSRLIRSLDEALRERNARTRIVFGEAGDIRYLYRAGTDKPGRDDQIREIFSPQGAHSVHGLATLAPVVSGHSYWSTWPIDTMIETRRQLGAAIREHLPAYTYWQTEYCPMEQNDDNPQGGPGRDTGINTALYIARVIHYDLTEADAASWQSWTAFSESNYKDGLIFIDDGQLTCGSSTGREPMDESCKYDGRFSPAKTLWSLGNYSFFIRPGMVRIARTDERRYDPTGVLASAYVDEERRGIAVVLLNLSHRSRRVALAFDALPRGYVADRFRIYETSARSDLQYKGRTREHVVLPPRSILTLVSDPTR